MAAGYLTVLDLVKQTADEGLVGLVDETIKAFPEVSGMTRIGPDWITLDKVGMAVDIPGFSYPTLVTTELPSVSFVNVNDGTDASKGVQDLRDTKCYDLNPKWRVGVRLADRHPKGIGYLMAQQAAMHLRASWIQIGKCFYYGTNPTFGDAASFPGLLQGYDATNKVIDVTGTSATGCSSVWLVAFGPEELCWVYGNNGNFRLSDVDFRDVLGANNKPMSAYCQELFAYPGLKFVSQLHVVRIKNISTQSGKNLTDNIIADALALFPAGVFPNVALMTRRTLTGLQKSRVAVNQKGDPAPIPSESNRVPIAVTDSISNAETPTL